MEMQKNTQPQQPEDLTPKIYYMTKDDLLPETISYVGRKMRLKEFHDWFDCEVEFTDDGYVAEHVVYGCYHFGNVKHPRDYFRYKYAGIGQRCTVRGRNVCIVDGKHTNDVTFMFDDGKIITHKPAKELLDALFGGPVRKEIAEKLAAAVKARPNTENSSVVLLEKNLPTKWMTSRQSQKSGL